MNLFGLIIQRTTSGLNDMFVSDNLKESRKSSEIEKTTDDENKYATKLANQSDVFTVQLTTNYRVYSLVITDATDSFGRAGFYAIRLYAPKKYPLANFEVILQQINKKYLEYESNETPKNSQEYNNLLKYDIPLEVKQQDFLHAKSNENTFCYYDPSNTQLSNIFNAKNVALFNKVYAFNQERAVSTEIIKSIGLKSLEEIKNNLKEIFITNSYKILKELKINNIPIEFNSSDSDFTVVLKKEDVIEYNTTDDSKFKQATGLIINVERKYIAPPQPRPRGPKKQGFLEEYGMYLIMVVMIVLLGIGSWYFFLRDDTPVIEDNPTVIEEPSTPTTVVDSYKIEFINDGSTVDSAVFRTTYPKLDKYRFRVNNEKWSYKNTKRKNKYVAFYKSDLDEIIKSDSLEFSEDKKNEFLNNLQKIGQLEILDKEVKGNTPNENSNPKETIKKEVLNDIKTKKDKQKTTSKKPETDEENEKRLLREKTAG